VKLPAVLSLMNKACQLMPWVRGEHMPTLRKRAEMELIRLAVFNAIVRLSPDAPDKLSGMIRMDRRSQDAGLIRLVDDLSQADNESTRT
jgi:hypothetical protein